MRGLRQKLDALRVQNGQSLSKYQGFGRKLICYKGISFFGTYLNSRLLWMVQNEPFKATSSVFNPFWLHLGFFMHLLIFLSKWPWNWKAIQIPIKKGWEFAWYHHFTHIACAKNLRGLRRKLDALRVQIDNLFRSIRVSDENSSVSKAFHFFKLISTPDFLCV